MICENCHCEINRNAFGEYFHIAIFENHADIVGCERPVPVKPALQDPLPKGIEVFSFQRKDRSRRYRIILNGPWEGWLFEKLQNSEVWEPQRKAQWEDLFQLVKINAMLVKILKNPEGSGS